MDRVFFIIGDPLSSAFARHAFIRMQSFWLSAGVVLRSEGGLQGHGRGARGVAYLGDARWAASFGT